MRNEQQTGEYIDKFWASVIGAGAIGLALWAFVDYVSNMPVM